MPRPGARKPVAVSARPAASLPVAGPELEPSCVSLLKAKTLDKGEYSPSLYRALRIAEYFEVPVEVIFSTSSFPRIGSTERSA